MSIPYSLRLPNLANLLLVLSRRELSIEQKLNADLARLHDNFPPSFVDRLPYADRGTIAAEDGQCPICLTAYGEDRGDGTTEEPTLLPCRHVIGRRCLEKFHCVQNTRPQDYEADSTTKCMLCRQTLFDYGFQWFVTKGAFSGPHVAAYKRAHDLNDKEVFERFMAAGLCFAKGWGWFWKLHRVVGPPLMASEAKKFSSDPLNDEALQTLAEDNLDCLQLLQKWIGTAKKPLDEVLATAIHQVVEKEWKVTSKRSLLSKTEVQKHLRWMEEFHGLHHQIPMETLPRDLARTIVFRQHCAPETIASYISRCAEPLAFPRDPMKDAIDNSENSVDEFMWARANWESLTGCPKRPSFVEVTIFYMIAAYVVGLYYYGCIILIFNIIIRLIEWHEGWVFLVMVLLSIGVVGLLMINLWAAALTSGSILSAGASFGEILKCAVHPLQRI